MTSPVCLRRLSVFSRDEAADEIQKHKRRRDLVCLSDLPLLSFLYLFSTAAVDLIRRFGML